MALKITISVIILLALMVGGLVAYTWYVGKNSPAVERDIDPNEGKPMAPKLEPKTPDANARVGVSVQSITAASPGSNASVTIRTLRDSKCTISVEYNGVKSTDSGLAPKTADEWGMVTWSWSVEPTVPEGKWPVKMLCERNKQSGAVQADLEVKKAQ